MMSRFTFDSLECFHTSVCPICGNPALEIIIPLSPLKYECGRCGAFDISAGTKSKLRLKNREQRVAWLACARRLALSAIPLIDQASEPRK